VSLQIRKATEADYDVFARLQPALGVSDPPLTAAQFAERMLPNVILACDGLRPIGYAHWLTYGATFHVAHVVVDAETRRRGAGSLLMQDLRRRAVDAGCTRWYLNVKADNGVAIRLYELSGLTIEQRAWALVSDWASLRNLTGRVGRITFDPPQEEVALFAQQHTIDPERLALVRKRPGRVFVALRDEVGLCALAVFDPHHPAIYPIAVKRPEDAHGLFEALSSHAQAQHVTLFVEGNASLAEALLKAGAKLEFEALRMGGSLS